MITNREIVSLFWLVLLILLCIKKNNKLINSFKSIFTLLFSKPSLMIYGSAVAYILITTLLLYHIGYWELGLIDRTIGWFICTVFVSLCKVAEERRGIKFFSNFVLSNIKIMAVVEFLCSKYTFGLWIEFLLVPFVGFLAMLDVVANHEDEFKVVAKITNVILVVLGMIVILNATCGVYWDIDNFVSYVNLKSITLPLVYSVIFLPFLYLFSVYVAYESLVFRLNLKQDNKVTFRTILLIFLKCRLSRNKLLEFQEHMYDKGVVRSELKC